MAGFAGVVGVVVAGERVPTVETAGEQPPAVETRRVEIG
jgi:hypothetical protein